MDERLDSYSDWHGNSFVSPLARMEYTVIGDEVNITARPEQLHKDLGSNVLVGPTTYQPAKNDFDFIPRGEQRK